MLRIAHSAIKTTSVKCAEQDIILQVMEDAKRANYWLIVLKNAQYVKAQFAWFVTSDTLCKKGYAFLNMEIKLLDAKNIFHSILVNYANYARKDI